VSKTPKNAIVDTERRPDIAFDTDHAVIIKHNHTNQIWKEKLLETTKNCAIRAVARAEEVVVVRSLACCLKTVLKELVVHSCAVAQH
jgi:hypothetical protein